MHVHGACLLLLKIKKTLKVIQDFQSLFNFGCLHFTHLTNFPLILFNQLLFFCFSLSKWVENTFRTFQNRLHFEIYFFLNPLFFFFPHSQLALISSLSYYLRQCRAVFKICRKTRDTIEVYVVTQWGKKTAVLQSCLLSLECRQLASNVYNRSIYKTVSIFVQMLRQSRRFTWQTYRDCTEEQQRLYVNLVLPRILFEFQSRATCRDDVLNLEILLFFLSLFHIYALCSQDFCPHRGAIV